MGKCGSPVQGPGTHTCNRKQNKIHCWEAWQWFWYDAIQAAAAILFYYSSSLSDVEMASRQKHLLITLVFITLTALLVLELRALAFRKGDIKQLKSKLCILVCKRKTKISFADFLSVFLSVWVFNRIPTLITLYHFHYMGEKVVDFRFLFPGPGCCIKVTANLISKG